MFLFALPSLAQDRASLTGKVKDITGAGIPGTQADLQSETVPDRRFRTSADSTGVYHFPGLPADEYALRLFSPGFRSLTVRSIDISEREQKALPVLQLEVGSVADCGGHAVLDYIRILPPGDHFGNLSGSINRGPPVGKGAPVEGADVILVCDTGKVCGATKSNADGEFTFKALPPGSLSVNVSVEGFYTLSEPGYTIEDGLESVYWPVYIERCPLGNCDPMLRSKKPPARCE